MKEQIVAIIPGGGSGSRMGLEYPKQFHLLAGDPVLIHTLKAFQESPLVTHIIAVSPEAYLEKTKKLIRQYHLDKVREIVPGGKKRQDSVKAGLNKIPDGTSLVIVHDAARPLVSNEIIESCLVSARRYGAAIAALPVNDTIKYSGEERFIEKTIDRSWLWQAQTPQVMKPDLLKKGFQEAEKKKFQVTDEASLLELIGAQVRLVEGSIYNIKITRPDDLLLAEAIIMRKKGKSPGKNGPVMKIGQGYDAHRLVEGRELILGGVKIPYEKGLLGHSDADVLIHALCDAILGALGLGDIGRHFPDSDPVYKNISSLKLLEEVVEMAFKRNYCLSNCDLTIVCQEPKLRPWFDDMLKNLTTACRVESETINLKATTTEKMGFTGRSEGISAYASVLLQAG